MALTDLHLRNVKLPGPGAA